ncbi:hypothetical protein [Nannocystis pusilla]
MQGPPNNPSWACFALASGAGHRCVDASRSFRFEPAREPSFSEESTP